MLSQKNQTVDSWTLLQLFPRLWFRDTASSPNCSNFRGLFFHHGRQKSLIYNLKTGTLHI